MSEHTATPWPEPCYDEIEEIARFEHAKDAAFAWRACNAHDDLVAALQDIVDYYTQAGIGDCTPQDEEDPPDGFDGDEVFNIRHARAALAKAERTTR